MGIQQLLTAYQPVIPDAGRLSARDSVAWLPASMNQKRTRQTGVAPEGYTAVLTKPILPASVVAVLSEIAIRWALES